MSAAAERTIKRANHQNSARESERQLKEAQMVSRVGSYHLDIRDGRWDSSEVLDKIFGIDEDFERSIEAWATLIHPDDRAQMVEYLTNEVMGNRSSFDREYRIVRNNDQVKRWVHGMGELDTLAWAIFSRAMSIMAAAMSIPQTRHWWRARSITISPGPQPMSSTQASAGKSRFNAISSM